MSNAIARILFASASLVLTCTLAVASASASVPSDATAPQQTVRYADLKLTTPEGRETLERRLRAAVNTVCADAGSPLKTIACHRTALTAAHAQVQRAVALAS